MNFPCGHKGYGQKCHRCAEEHKVSQEKQNKKNTWKETFNKDPINLRPFPKNVVLNARQILQGLANQEDYRNFHGKRLRHDRFIMSIPVTRHYRLIYRDHGSFLTPEAVVSHEDYNVCQPGR